MTFRKNARSKPKLNLVHALKNRSTGLFRGNPCYDTLHLYGEKCAATLCTDNKKVELPPRTRSTFMTAFSPDQKLAASCHGDHNVHVTDIKTRKVVKSLTGHERSPWCISFHPSSSDILATGCLNGEVRVWDLRGGGSESLVFTSETSNTITSLSFHPTDRVLLIAAGNEVFFWDWGFNKPLVSIKTASPAERVQLVRFDSLGNNIITGIANIEAEQTSGEDDENNEDGASDWSSDVGLTSSGRLQRRSYLRNWLSSVSPVLTVTASRSSASRPMTASYNLRGRHDARSSTNSTETTSSSSASVRTDVHEQSRRRFRRFLSLRQQLSDISHAHTYTRDHQRILHARVSVNAEIQHQYNRLQMLQEERRRLEMRLEQLQNHPSAVRPSAVARVYADAASRSSRHDTDEDADDPMLGDNSSTVDGGERNGFEDYSDITELLVARVQARLLQTLNDDSIQVSVNWSNPSSRSNNISTPPSTETSSTPPSTDQSSTPPSTNPSLRTRFSNRLPSYNLLSASSEPQDNVSNSSSLPLVQPSLSPSSSTSSPLIPLLPLSHDAPPFTSVASHPVRMNAAVSSSRSRSPISPFRPRYPGNSNPNEPDAEPNLGQTSSRMLQNRIRRHRMRQHWRHRHRSRGNFNPIWPYDTHIGHFGRNDKATFRLQWWDFTKLKMPEIESPNLNVVVPHCKIHNDSSVDISKDQKTVAALVWSPTGLPHLVHVGVFSLERHSFGQILFRKDFGPAQYPVCVSLSPLCNYLAAGLKSYSFLNEGLLPNRGSTAEVFEINSETSGSPVHKIPNPGAVDTPERYASINTIAWLPEVGQGLLYGTNNGELRICYVDTSPVPQKNPNLLDPF